MERNIYVVACAACTQIQTFSRTRTQTLNNEALNTKRNKNKTEIFVYRKISGTASFFFCGTKLFL